MKELAYAGMLTNTRILEHFQVYLGRVFIGPHELGRSHATMGNPPATGHLGHGATRHGAVLGAFWDMVPAPRRISGPGEIGAGSGRQISATDSALEVKIQTKKRALVSHVRSKHDKTA